MSNTPPGAERYLHPKGNLIDGEIVAAASGKTLAVEDPSTGQTISAIPASAAADVDAAVKAARKSFDAGVWAKAEPSHRGRVLWTLATKIREQLEPLAYLETLDSGKPIVEARADVVGTADIIEYYAGLATKIAGQTMPLPGKALGMVLREPAGVVGQITPWNFPLYVGAWKFAPALCAGCSIVLKPSELFAALADLLRERKEHAAAMRRLGARPVATPKARACRRHRARDVRRRARRNRSERLARRRVFDIDGRAVLRSDDLAVDDVASRMKEHARRFTL
jgi:acyl-CoA reductase-like NAD-dependent aldehyde dehydrogenase